ncbi:hypothetical protein NSQ20_20480 [Paenibacillus sp. FSL K6-1122]|uniref:hypothetical protein n=1 Tax=Paenibacillus TaxID=44249 RepID=UPI0003E256DE|nr:MULTISPECIES: hypothetical protein [Paenibacillus]ETT53328.1 hypothetical protein C170_07154 [Paenibacillus sp. FSL H7-689]MCF7753468.1 hypothetical protein [Paenibacillus xylanexedens]OME98579.1 hypothetical protein BK124_15330 [Paenibacillus amylolyticus]OMF45499.1 hypothetical protein BK136_10395 [Paenibacillus amylolyticus]PKQ91430.1 hypothetical protein CXK86_08920 [Paenibacillus sp. BGI2013]
MTHMIKAKDDKLTEEIVSSMIGKYIHAPTNMHEIQTPTGATTKANVWFAGRVAGYEKAIIGFNYEEGTFHEELQTFYNVHLTDGMGYILTSAYELEIHELTEEEFNQLIEEKKEEEQDSSGEEQ